MIHVKYVNHRRIAMGKHFTFIIDRFEEDWAVLEYEGKTFDVPRALLPDNAKEGDMLRISLDIDLEETLKRKEAIKKLEDELFE
jgi:hypothetical protein